MAKTAILDLCSNVKEQENSVGNEFLMRNTLTRVNTLRFLSDRNVTYLLQDGNDGHLRFMHERDIKIKMTFSCEIHLEK